METILVGIVIFLASVLQGAFGFAFMLFAVPLVSFILDVKTAVPLLALLSFSTALIYWVSVFRLSGSRRFDYRKIKALFIGAPLGIPIGIFFLIQFDVNLLKLVLGIVLILYSAYSLFNKRMVFQLPAWTGYLFGFFSGILGGAFNMGGPPVVFYISTKDWLKIDVISSLSLFYLAQSTLIILFHILVGNISRNITLTFLEILPAEILGIVLGTYIFRNMSEEKYKKRLFILLLLIGIMLMIRP